MTIGNTNTNSSDVIQKFNAAIVKLPKTDMPPQVESMLKYINQYTEEIQEKGERLKGLVEEINELAKKVEALY